jgi:hypothetical protein
MQYHEIALFALAVLIAVVAVKVGISFDLNKFLEYRHKRKEERFREEIRRVCPHITPVPVGQEYEMRPSMMPRPGTSFWICERCGWQTQDEGLIDRILEQMKYDPDGLIKRELKMRELAKKRSRRFL